MLRIYAFSCILDDCIQIPAIYTDPGSYRDKEIYTDPGSYRDKEIGEKDQKKSNKNTGTYFKTTRKKEQKRKKTGMRKDRKIRNEKEKKRN